MRRVLAALTLAAASPLPAMAGVAECKSLIEARNGGLARPYERALRKHQSSAEGKQLVDAALAELYTQLSAEAGGWKQQARGFAASLEGVAKAMRNLIVGLTPEGSIASIEEGAKKVRGAQGRFDDLLKPSPADAKGDASGARKDKAPKAGDAIAAATEELGKSLAAELVAKSLAPVAKNLKGLHVLRGQAKKLAELDEASDELAALKAAIQLRVTEVEYELRGHDKRLDAELRTLQALNPKLQAIAQSVQARCDAKLCAGIESDGIKEQVDAEQQATRLTRQAADLRAKGSPGLTRIDDGFQKLVDEQKSLELDSAGREAALRKKVEQVAIGKARDLDELRRGLFCSKCHRTAGEIQSAEHVDFTAHLGAVQGYPVPAPPWAIAEKARDHDRKLEQLGKDFEALKKRHGDAEARLRKRQAELIAERDLLWAQHAAKILELETAAFGLARKGEERLAEQRREAESCRTELASTAPARRSNP